MRDVTGVPSTLPDAELRPPIGQERPPRDLEPGLHGWAWTVPAAVTLTPFEALLLPGVLCGAILAVLSLDRALEAIVFTTLLLGLWALARILWQGPVRITVDEAAHRLQIAQGRRTWDAPLPLTDWQRTPFGMRLLGARIRLNPQDADWLVREISRPRPQLTAPPPPPALQELLRSRQEIPG